MGQAFGGAYDVSDPYAINKKTFTDTTKTGEDKQRFLAEMEAAKARTAPTVQAAQVGPAERVGTPQIANVNGINAASIAGVRPTIRVDTTQQDEFRGHERNLANDLVKQASGQGPSLAGEQATKTARQLLAQRIAAEAGARPGGSSPGLTRRNIAQSASQLEADAINTAAEGRMKEQAIARDQLGGVLGGARAADIEVARANSQLDSQTQTLDAQRNLTQAELEQRARTSNFDASNTRALELARLATNSDQFNATQANTFAQRNAELEQQARIAAMEAELKSRGLNDAQIAQMLKNSAEITQSDRAAAMEYENQMAAQELAYEQMRKSAEETAAARSAQLVGGAMNAAGGLAMMSDPKQKKDVEEVDPDKEDEPTKGQKGLAAALKAMGGALSTPVPATNTQPAGSMPKIGTMRYVSSPGDDENGDPNKERAAPTDMAAYHAFLDEQRKQRDQARNERSTAEGILDPLGAFDGGTYVDQSLGSRVKQTNTPDSLVYRSGLVKQGPVVWGDEKDVHDGVTTSANLINSFTKKTAGTALQGMRFNAPPQPVMTPQTTTFKMPDQVMSPEMKFRYTGTAQGGGFGVAPQVAPRGDVTRAAVIAPGKMKTVSTPAPQYAPQTAAQASAFNARAPIQNQSGMPGFTATSTAAPSPKSGIAPDLYSTNPVPIVSDPKKKDDVDEAVENKLRGFLDSLTAYEYEYVDPSKPGRAPGRHTSVMADDLERTPMGKRMVVDTPDGKMVDYARGFGVMLAAQASINERLERLEGKKPIQADKKKWTPKPGQALPKKGSK